MPNTKAILLEEPSEPEDEQLAVIDGVVKQYDAREEEWKGIGMEVHSNDHHDPDFEEEGTASSEVESHRQNDEHDEDQPPKMHGDGRHEDTYLPIDNVESDAMLDGPDAGEIQYILDGDDNPVEFSQDEDYFVAWAINPPHDGEPSKDSEIIEVRTGTGLNEEEGGSEYFHIGFKNIGNENLDAWIAYRVYKIS